MRRLIVAILAIVGFCLPGFAAAQPLPQAKPEQVGISSDGLSRLTQFVQTEVGKGELPGVVMMVARKGRLAYVQAIGAGDPATNSPMKIDAIFRIYSMTKPITSVAAMMLVEEGRLQVTDPVSKYIPEFSKGQVAVEKLDASGKTEITTVPVSREMTIQDLLRHTSGLTYSFFGKSVVKDLYKSSGIGAGSDTNAEFVDKLAKIPLQFQPGTTWEYSVSTDVLGRVIEVVAGMPLGRFLDERIFQPLKMADSGFVVPAEKQSRLAQPLPGGQPMIDVSGARKFESGGGGGVSTAVDYLRFSQMLLDGGRFEQARLLSRKTVEFMTADHLGTISPPVLPGHGFGLGFAVRRSVGGASEPGSAGEYYWLGAGGTHFWVDPKEQLIGVWMAQHLGLAKIQHYRRAFKTFVSQALTD